MVTVGMVALPLYLNSVLQCNMCSENTVQSVTVHVLQISVVHAPK